jgi:hypothetical protein
VKTNATKFAKSEYETQALAGRFEHLWLEIPVDTGVYDPQPRQIEEQM